MVATAAQTMTTRDTDATFAPDAPALPATEPALAFMGASRRRLGARPGQDHTSHPAFNRRLFVAGRAETTVARGQIRRAPEDGLMPIQRRGPQRDAGRAQRVYVEGRHDLMFRFLNGYVVAELVRFRDFAFADRHRVPFEEAENLAGAVRVAAEYARACLIDDALDQRPHRRQPAWARCKIGRIGGLAVCARCRSRRPMVAASRSTARVVAIRAR